MEFYAHVDDDIMAQWAESATQDLDRRVTALEEGRRPKAHAPTIASQSEARRDEGVKYLEAMIDELRTDIAQKNTLIESQAQTIKDQAQKIARQNHTISDLRTARDVYVDDLKRRLTVTNADNRRVTSKLSEIHKALRYRGDVHPQAHLDQVRRTAAAPVPTRRFR